MLNFKRGFRRLGWVLTALCAPFVFEASYEKSVHVARYELKSIEPDIPLSMALDEPVEVDGVGIIHFPGTFTKPEIETYLRQHVNLRSSPALFRRGSDLITVQNFARLVRQKYPEFSDPDDIKLTKAVLVKFPEYRASVAFGEYQVEPTMEKRWGWAAGVTTMILILLSVVIQGAISVASWVFRGFKANA